jgi:hypothetical protein
MVSGVVDPALMLGAAVVKTACKLWLKDNAIAADAAVGVVEIIQAQVAEVREQRRVRRMFEDLEERVADNVSTCLDLEFGGVPENERSAATLAVADTFDKAALTNRDLFAADLDAARLFRAVKPLGRRYTATLSQDATELYERVLHDCCAYVVEVANVLPGFEVGVFGEILARQHEIMRHVDQRFDRLPMQLGGAGAETFEPTYLRLVAKQLDKVELFGVTVSDRVGNYPLSVAYVSLSICSSMRLDAAFTGLPEEEAKPERHVASIEEALGATKRAFVRGEAGSGKTTLLQWLAVRCGRRDFDGPMRAWNGCVPLFIRLRRYSGAELPAPEDFLHEVGRNIAHTMPLNWVHDLLRAGRAVVLVDGVDELPEPQRRLARYWLRALLLSYPDARYVVTSRPAAAAEAWLEGEAFDALEIQPMTTADIDAFVSHWHSALADGVTNTAESERIETSRRELVQTIRTRRHLRMLTVSPLMTALICALHLDRRMQLPNDRVELYSVALEMLLERRDNEREIQASDVTITRADKMLILEDLAYWLVRNGWSDAAAERVLERLTDKLATMHRVQAGAEDVLKHLLDRSGLLRTPVEGQVDFVHKTFQEFLAAKAAVAADDIGVLVRNAHDDQWREVVLMAVAHARPHQTDQLLREILARAEREDDHRYVLLALAVGCIQQAPQLSPELHQRLHDIAVELLPPKHISEATALAGAGDLVLELLSGTEHDYTRKEAAATIRMAAIIGGDHAMSVIARCARSGGSRVREELAHAWPKFDPEEFARQVLVGSPASGSVDVQDPRVLPALGLLPITHLTCWFAHGYGNIDYVRSTPELRFFSVLDSKLNDLRPLAEQPELRELVLAEGGMPVDISPLGRCEALGKVSLPFGSIAGEQQLQALRSLRVLEFSDDAPLNRVIPNLAQELRLDRLGLRSARSVTELDELIAAPQLAQLNILLLGQADNLESIAGIDRWAETATGIYLRASRLTDVERLSSLKHLSFANLTDTPIKSLDFLRGNSSLNTLYIGGLYEPLPELAPLCDLPALLDLHIRGAGPVDLSGLAGSHGLHVEIEGHGRAVHGLEKLPDSVQVNVQ